MDSTQILYGEMFDQDHYPSIERTANNTEYFTLSDWEDFTITFDRCILN